MVTDVSRQGAFGNALKGGGQGTFVCYAGDAATRWVAVFPTTLRPRTNREDVDPEARPDSAEVHVGSGDFLWTLYVV
jgi:hypothetical protein